MKRLRRQKEETRREETNSNKKEKTLRKRNTRRRNTKRLAVKQGTQRKMIRLWETRKAFKEIGIDSP